MEITKVNVYPVEKENPKLKAFAEAYIDDGLVITGIRIINGQKGLFVAMPDRKENKKEGEERYQKHRDIVHPINSEVRKMFTDAILAKYNEVIAEKED